MDEPPCQYRSPEPLGTVYCGCSQVTRSVYWCDHQAISSYVTLHAGRIKKHRVKLTGGGEDTLTTLHPPVCVLCPHRPDALPALKDLLVQKEPPPNPSPPVRSESHQNALVAICSNCPRINTKGLPVTCNGQESAFCPQDLWPDLEAARKSANSGRRSQCCG